MSQYSNLDIYNHEQELLKCMMDELKLINNINIHGQPTDKAGIIGVYFFGAHMSDVAIILDQQGVAVRSMAAFDSTDPSFHREYQYLMGHTVYAP